jgi:hypothetical protein
MKKLFLFLFAGITLGLTGCFETTEEITLNEDGSGTYVGIFDMSKLVPVLKNMGMGDQVSGKTMDSSFALGITKESTEGLSEDDIMLLKKGTMKVKMNMDDEIMKSTMNFPFSSLKDLPRINKLTSKSMMQSLMSQMGGSLPPGAKEQMGEPSSMADYYTLEFESGELKRKLNKEKYANVASDKYLSQMQEAGAMGIPITYTVIINLPKPAEKLEGKNAKLSDDKKQVTVKGTIDEFFDSPEKLEFKVKY